MTTSTPSKVRPIRLSRLDWQPFDQAAPPAASGVYAIRSGARWLYVGMAQDIAKRLRQPQHPAQITRGLALPREFHWHPCPAPDLRSLESRLISQYAPEWNGGTEREATYGCAGPTCRARVWLPPTAGERDAMAAALALIGG